MIKQLILPLFAITLSAAQPAAWNFETETPTLEQGWTATTDQIVAGSSFVQVQAEAEAGNGNTALRIHGEARKNNSSPVKEVLPFAGAIHYFSATPFRPADFTQARTLSFRAKGAGSMEVALFHKATGVAPSSKTVKLGAEWKEYRFELSSFNVDKAQLTAIAFGKTSQGTLDILVDDIRIQ
ncbi:hypothetical protein [Holophaga foetida]|uniref:hypothetical protein n=1 Tax=Holophaga foetida TaxID=35839 RepID=UPI0002471CAA|nr:hypothetical protein [Holophaga foetida]